MTLQTRQYIDALVSHMLASGHFESVNGAEPGAMPGNSGLAGAVWFTRIRPIGEASGLASVSIVMTMNVRLFTSLNTSPFEEIDPAMVSCVDDLMNAFIGDFTLGGLVRCVDVLGMYGTMLESQSGYVETDQVKLRVVDITVPLVIDDVWTEAP